MLLVHPYCTVCSFNTLTRVEVLLPLLVVLPPPDPVTGPGCSSIIFAVQCMLQRRLTGVQRPRSMRNPIPRPSQILLCIPAAPCLGCSVPVSPIPSYKLLTWLP